MVNTDTARTAVGVIGNGISLILFLSPLPTYFTIWKRKAVEEFSPVPYLATLLNCMLWVFYGLPIVHPDSLLVVTINGAGLVLETLYLSFFFYFSPRNTRLKILKVLAGELIFMAAVIVGVMVGAHTSEKRSLIVGILCVIFGTCMYAAPLSVMKLVIKTKSVEYMPFYLSLAGFSNGICWTLYALLRFDIFIILPNGLGALFGFSQLVLYATYYKTTPKKGARQELELPTTDAATTS